MHIPNDKVLRYLTASLSGLAIFFMLHALAIPVKGLLELRSGAIAVKKHDAADLKPVADRPVNTNRQMLKEYHDDHVHPRNQYSFRA